jgi:hypothetical protein
MSGGTLNAWQLQRQLPVQNKVVSPQATLRRAGRARPYPVPTQRKTLDNETSVLEWAKWEPMRSRQVAATAHRPSDRIFQWGVYTVYSSHAHQSRSLTSKQAGMRATFTCTFVQH